MRDDLPTPSSFDGQLSWVEARATLLEQERALLDVKAAHAASLAEHEALVASAAANLAAEQPSLARELGPSLALGCVAVVFAATATVNTGWASWLGAGAGVASIALAAAHVLRRWRAGGRARLRSERAYAVGIEAARRLAELEALQVEHDRVLQQAHQASAQGRRVWSDAAAALAQREPGRRPRCADSELSSGPQGGGAGPSGATVAPTGWAEA